MSAGTHLIELLPAYALDCLDDEEYVRVSEHVALCADCRAELSSYQNVADQLALAVPEVDPPKDLKHRLMSRIQPVGPTVPSLPRTSWWEQLTNLMQRITPAWGLASLLLVLILVISNLWLWQQTSRLPVEIEPGAMRTINLSGTEVASGAIGLIVVSVDGEHGTLVVDGLPPLDEAHQYQLWLIEDGQRTNGGVFSVSEEGYGSLWLSSPQPLSSYSAFGVTIEPAGGSAGPTGDRVLGSTP